MRGEEGKLLEKLFLPPLALPTILSKLLKEKR
jgi:hypothetical protein